jgi:hypothetical protein
MTQLRLQASDDSTCSSRQRRLPESTGIKEESTMMVSQSLLDNQLL